MRKTPQPIQIKLSNSDRVALIDEEDWLLVSPYTWRVKTDDRTDTLYIATSVRRGKKVETIRLHRLVMNAQPGMDVHHKNFDTYDNRKENLIEVSPDHHRGHGRDYEYSDEVPF